MPPIRRRKPRVFVDANVLFAGAASPSKHGASLVILRLGEITLIEGVTSQQVIAEAERNLEEKLPQSLPAFRLLVSRCLRVVPDPRPEDLATYAGAAEPKDLPILVAAVREACPWLVTFNVRHFQPGLPDVTVLRPGDFIRAAEAVQTTYHPPEEAGVAVGEPGPTDVGDATEGAKVRKRVPLHLRRRLRLRFAVPRGKVSGMMGVMNLLQHKFDRLEIVLAAEDGEISEQEYEDKIQEAFRQLGIEVVEE